MSSTSGHRVCILLPPLRVEGLGLTDLSRSSPPVDENLYFRSINKSEAAPARRDQTHGLAQDVIEEGTASSRLDIARSTSKADSAIGTTSAGKERDPDAPKQPPYMFHNAQSLEALTRQHNVGARCLVSLFATC